MIPEWFLLALGCAVFEAFGAIATKKLASKADPIFLTCVTRLATVPLLLPFVFQAGVTIPAFDSHFWWYLAVNGSLMAAASILTFKAFRRADLSLAAPLLNFTPLFLIVTAFLILGERPSLIGTCGILLITAGAYFMNTAHHESRWEPIKRLFTNPAAVMMLLVAIIFSITSTVDKLAVQASSALFWVICLKIFMGLATLPWVLRMPRRTILRQVRGNIGWITAGSLFAVGASIAQMLAIQMTLVTYVISVKRLSAIFVVILSMELLRERRAKHRLIGVGVMVAGVALISIF